MLEQCYRQLEDNREPRENLSRLRMLAKEPDCRERLAALVGDGELLFGFLKHEDPKVRKNAALLCGTLQLEQAAAVLVEAYRREETLFVKGSFLVALLELDTKEYLDFFRERLSVLSAIEPKPEERKHREEEIRRLQQLVDRDATRENHTFTGFRKTHVFLLTTNREQREVTKREIDELSAGVHRKTGMHPLGILVQSAQLTPFLRLRTYRELLFPLRVQEADQKTMGASDPQKAAAAVFASGVVDMLTEWYREDTPFYFRVEYKGHLPADKKGSYIKSFAARLEQLSGRRLINAAGDYEIEIRLLETREGTLLPFLRIPALTAPRFAYRKQAIASSIHPATAAMLVRLAEPYLKEDAQILDPFCGVGTMLIERDILVPAWQIYGIDIFGDAIRKARENASAAGEQINFINRDYFDFRHDYLFDEIITNFPLRGKKSKEEMDGMYAAFFEKSKQVLTPDGIIVLYSNEEGYVKKQLRLHPEFCLKQEFLVREKEHFCLFVIGRRADARGRHEK